MHSKQAAFPSRMCPNAYPQKAVQYRQAASGYPSNSGPMDPDPARITMQKKQISIGGHKYCFAQSTDPD